MKIPVAFFLHSSKPFPDSLWAAFHGRVRYFCIHFRTLSCFAFHKQPEEPHVCERERERTTKTSEGSSAEISEIVEEHDTIHDNVFVDLRG